MDLGWLKIAGKRFYARSHSDGVQMNDGVTLTAKIKEIFTKLKEHHHHASEVNDFETEAARVAGNVVADKAPPKSHATNAQTYGGATGTNYGHVRTAGNVSGTNQYVVPFSIQYASTAQTTLNSANFLYNGVYAIRFNGSATGAPSGLTSGTTYYGTMFTMNFQQTSSVSSTYGVTQILSIPIIGKLYCRFPTSTSKYGDWIDLTAIASGWA